MYNNVHATGGPTVRGYIPLLAEQRVLGFCYIVGTYHDKTFCLLWNRVTLQYFSSYNLDFHSRARVLLTQAAFRVR